MSEAQARAATKGWPEDSLLLTSKPEALGGWRAAKDAKSGRGVCCLRIIANWDRVESVNSKHWGGLLRDFTLSCQGCDLISFEEKKKERKKEQQRTYIPKPSVRKSRHHNASECTLVLFSLQPLSQTIGLSET